MNTYRHPRSGELYVEAAYGDGEPVLLGPCWQNEDGQACDPLTHTPLTPEMAADWASNLSAGDLEDARDDWYRLVEELAAR